MGALAALSEPSRRDEVVDRAELQRQLALRDTELRSMIDSLQRQLVDAAGADVLRQNVQQDIDCAWRLIEGDLSGGYRFSEDGLKARFRELFPIVQQCNSWARTQRRS